MRPTSARPFAFAALLASAALANAQYAPDSDSGVLASTRSCDGWFGQFIPGDPERCLDDYHAAGGTGALSAMVNAQSLYAHSTASGSLSSGALHLGAWADQPPGYGTTSSDAYATVAMWDTVTVFNGSGKDIDSLLMHIRFDGDSGGDAAVHFVYSGVMANADSNYEPQDLYSVDDELLLEPLVPGSSVSFRISAGASVRASCTWDGGWYNDKPAHADYTHTLKFMWDLPEGVTFTSASGAFNPQPFAQPVPEPAAFAPLGLGAMAMLKRRRASR